MLCVFARDIRRLKPALYQLLEADSGISLVILLRDKLLRNNSASLRSSKARFSASSTN
jgi:hypothetical protein